MSFLTEEELFTLTKRVQASARIRVLKRQGIAFKLDADGAPAVSWMSVNAQSGRIPTRAGPNYEALNKVISERGKTKKNRPRTP